MTKRKTKAQREQEKKDALLQRIVDIYSGAAGDDASCTDWSAWPEVLARVIPAVRDRFGQPWDHWYGYQAHCLDRWETPSKACGFLYEHGFRADKVWPEADA